MLIVRGKVGLVAKAGFVRAEAGSAVRAAAVRGKVGLVASAGFVRVEAEWVALVGQELVLPQEPLLKSHP